MLLITSRTTRRWIVPKGWAERRVTPREQAAREAFEEAGLEGEIGAKRLGSYRYLKQRRNGPPIQVKVDVFLLEVVRQHEEWPEKGQRQVMWIGLAEAAGLVDDPGLAEILRGLAERLPRAAPEEEEPAVRPTT